VLAGLRQARGPRRLELIGITRRRYVRFWGSPDMVDYPPRLVYDANDPMRTSRRQLILFRIDPIFTESLKKLVEALPDSIFQLSPGVQAFGFIKVPIKRASNSWPGRY
jgi:hypothetical protein